MNINELRQYCFDSHVRAARVTVLGLCVCVSVYAYSCTTGNEAAYERYQQHQCNKRSKNKNVAKTTAFEVEKLTLSRTTLRDPAHQLAVCEHACIYVSSRGLAPRPVVLDPTLRTSGRRSPLSLAFCH